MTWANCSFWAAIERSENNDQNKTFEFVLTKIPKKSKSLKLQKNLHELKLREPLITKWLHFSCQLLFGELWRRLLQIGKFTLSPILIWRNCPFEVTKLYRKLQIIKVKVRIRRNHPFWSYKIFQELRIWKKYPFWSHKIV